jgi:hypothetical protein
MIRKANFGELKTTINNSNIRRLDTPYRCYNTSKKVSPLLALHALFDLLRSLKNIIKK